MYYLKKNPQLLSSFEATKGVREWALAVLADSTSGLTFEPDEHRYFLGGREMQSVSSIVEHFCPFDKAGTAARCAANSRHPLYGKSVDEIIEIWEKEGREAAQKGTDLHAFGEACFLFMTGQDELIEPDFRERVTPDGLVAVEAKEESLARWWAEMNWNRFVPIAKETRIVNPVLGYAGTFDLLLWDLFNYSFVVEDYKSNKDLDRWFGDYAIAPLSMIRTNDIGKYTIQQTLYTIQLRNIGFVVNGNNLIWLREESYQERPLSLNYDKVIEYAARMYLQSLKN